MRDGSYRQCARNGSFFNSYDLLVARLFEERRKGECASHHRPGGRNGGVTGPQWVYFPIAATRKKTTNTIRERCVNSE